MGEKKLRSIILYYLFSSIRELGIDLPLLFRRITEVSGKDINYLSEEFFGGKIRVENFNQLIEDLVRILKQEKLMDDIEVKIVDEEVNLLVKNCTYLDMAIKAKNFGENSCPLCLISLAASIASSITSGYSFNSVTYTTDVSKRECDLKISFTKS